MFSRIVKMKIDINNMLTVSCIFNSSEDIFFYGLFAYIALFPRNATICPYMDMISRKIKVKIEVFEHGHYMFLTILRHFSFIAFFN